MKKQMTGKSRLIMILVALMILSGCGNSNSTAVQETADSMEKETAAVETEVKFPYALQDYGGYTFTFLNMQDVFWTGAHQIIDYEETQASIAEQAIYERNRKTEEELNILFQVEKVNDLGELFPTMKQAVTAGDDIYDTVYLPLNWSGTSALGGDCTINLYEIESLHLENPWWNQTFIQSASINDALYATIDYINLMGYCYSHIPFFNKDIVEEHSMEMPYELVKEEKWTYDEMFRYIENTVSLGDETEFKAVNTTTATFGLACNNNDALIAFWQGCGSNIVERKDDDTICLNTDMNRIIDAFDTMLPVLSQKGNCVKALSAEATGLSLFTNGKSLFYIASLGSGDSGTFRDSDVRYGILPIPMLDESQNGYITTVNQYTLTMNVPLTSSDMERTGNILCYLEYLSWKDVIPELQRSLCYKGLSDEDSIQMMNIILDTTAVDIGIAYGWTLPMMDGLCNEMLNGNQTFVSTYEQQKNMIQTEIDTVLQGGKTE